MSVVALTAVELKGSVEGLEYVAALRIAKAQGWRIVSISRKPQAVTVWHWHKGEDVLVCQFDEELRVKVVAVRKLGEAVEGGGSTVV